MKKGSVQIIAGQYRRRKIEFDAVDGLRPTGSRIRETLFNWLTPSIEGAIVLDLFAGSGALLFEAVSRGAKQAIAIECEPVVIKQLQQTSKQLGCDNVTIISADAQKILSNPSILPTSHTPRQTDIVFIDPPFAMNIQSSLLKSLAQHQWLNNGALVYVETAQSTSLQIPNDYQLQKQKSSGNVSYYLLSYHC